MTVLPAPSVSVRVIVIDVPSCPLSPRSPLSPFGIVNVLPSVKVTTLSPVLDVVIVAIPTDVPF